MIDGGREGSGSPAQGAFEAWIVKAGLGLRVTVPWSLCLYSSELQLRGALTTGSGWKHFLCIQNGTLFPKIVHYF